MNTWNKIRLGIALALIALCIYISTIPASYGYTVEAQFSKLPPNDTELKDWLARQPGVIDRTIHIKRSNGGKVRILLIISRNVWGNPPFPDLDAACESLGYSGPNHEFKDVPLER